MAKRRIIAHVLARVCFPYNRFCGFIRAQRVKSRRCFIQIERLTLLNHVSRDRPPICGVFDHEDGFRFI